jgi:HK97 family phage portal protein
MAWDLRQMLPDRLRMRTLASEFPSMDAQIAAIRNSQVRAWRPASVNEALGVPSILGAVSLIANTMGTFSLEAYRVGSLLKDRNEIPRLIIRPNPFTKPYDFWRDTALYNASRGEFWWWIAHRDIDDQPDALYPVPPWEIRVEANQSNRLRPIIRWLDRVIPNEDMRHHMYLPDHSGLRGVGPLQLAGAAVSVAVEADAWASNFFSGSLPSVVGTTDADMTEAELKLMDKQWLEKPSNLPRWLTNGLKLSEPPYDAQKAQLTESRQFQVGEVARMFSMPGELIEHQMGGSSLTYRNQEGIWGDFQRRCLSPHYLEPIEQEMSDLLTRATVARFNTNQLLRADIKTRFEVYESGVTKSGVLSIEEARQMEGLAPGHVDFAPVPQTPPAAMPGPIKAHSGEVRCPNGHLLAEMASPPYRFTCFRCKQAVAA